MLAVLGAAFFVSGLEGAAPAGGPAVEVVEGLPGRQARLSWPAGPGLRYRVEKSADLAPDGWVQQALVETTGAEGAWVDPAPFVDRGFYRVSGPEAEVFQIDPPILSASGGALYLYGQCIPAGSALVLDIEGSGPVQAALEDLGGGVWRAVVSGSFVPGANVLSSAIVDEQGLPLVELDQPIAITFTGRADDSPGMLPPAAPVATAIIIIATKKGYDYYKAHSDSARESLAWPDPDDCDDKDDDPGPMGLWFSKKGYDYYQAQTASTAFWLSKKGYDYYQAQTASNAFWLSKKGYDYYQAQSSLSTGRARATESGIPGEVSFRVCDLELETPAGPALAWVRTYRSMVNTGSGHGTGGAWDFSYNIRIEPLPAGAGSSAPRLVVYDGGGRADVYYRQTDGSYRCNGFFREGRFTGDVFTLTFADTGKWTFNMLGSSLDAGKIHQITDRNGVSLTCDYDSSGRLASVSNPFGQTLHVEWDALNPGLIAQIRDATGRFVGYQYYGAADPDGSEGDLAEVSCPQAGGEPPVAGNTVYAYSTGFADPRRNHNLLSVHDGAGRLLEAFSYAAAGDPLAVDYDTCAEHDTNRAGGSGHVTLIKFESLPAGEAPEGGYRMLQNDELGRVCEVVFDRQHRPVRMRQYSGFADPASPPDLVANPPVLALDLRTEPDYYETLFSYNADHALTRCVLPDGSEFLTTFEGDLNPAASVRERGNARSVTLRAPGGGERTVQMEYLPGFGSPEPCARPGNPIGGISIKGGRNPGGNIQPNARPGNPIGGLTIKAGRNPGGYYQANARTGNPLYTGGPAGDNPLHESAAKERGITINTSHVEYQTNRLAYGDWRDTDSDDDGVEDFFRKILDYGEAGDNVSFVSRFTTAHGQVYQWTYDTAGNCLGRTTPIPGAGHLAGFNGLGQCTSLTILDGPGSSLRTSLVYDPVTAFLEAVVCDDNPEGTGLALTTILGRDTLGRVTSVIDPRSEEWVFEYNPLDRCVRFQSPPVGPDPVTAERTTTTYAYDAGGRLARCDVEHRDQNGVLVSANPAYSTFLVYDERARLAQLAVEELPYEGDGLLPPGLVDIWRFAVCDYQYDDAGQVVRITTPNASRAQDEDLVWRFAYDARGQLYRCSVGNPTVIGEVIVTTQFDYDAAGALERVAAVDATSDAGTVLASSVYAYDGFHRLAACTDPMGNVMEFEYDNKGFVTCSTYGEVEDLAGSAGNVLLARSTSRFRSADTKVLNLEKHPKRRLPSLIDIAMTSAGATHSPPLPPIMALSLPGVGNVCYDLKASAAFHGYVAEDDTIAEERFSPGAPAPHAVETTVLDRSPSGLLRNVTRNGDTVLSLTYDSAWRPATCANGACLLAYGHDAAGNLTSVARTDFSDVPELPGKTFTVTFDRDRLGRLTGRTDGSGNHTSWELDSLGRCVVETQPGGLVLTHEYDGSDGLSNYSHRTIGDLDGDGAPEVLFSRYARSGEMCAWADSHGHTTLFRRDGLGRCFQIDHPDGTNESVEFDAMGRAILRRTHWANQIAAEYDSNSRVVGLSWTYDPAASVLPVADTTYGYDGLGRLTRCEQGTSVITMEYDSLGDMVGESQDSKTIIRTFNHRGRTGITYPDGREFQEARDALGLLLSASLVSGGVVQSPPVVENQYSGNRVIRRTLGNGVVTTYAHRGDGEAPPLPGAPDASFDQLVRATVVDGSASLLADTWLLRDPNQRLVRHDTAFADGGPDAPGRRLVLSRNALGFVDSALTERQETPGGGFVAESSVAYTLDLEGRRLLATGGAHPGAYFQDDAIPPGDQQMGQYSSWPGGALLWNEEGWLTSLTDGASTLEYAYDASGRLIEVIDSSTGTATVSFAYDGFGRRVSMSVPGGGGKLVKTRFIYDGDVCIQEIADDDLADFSFVADGAGLHCAYTRTGLQYLHKEGIVHRDLAARNILLSGRGGDIPYVGPCDADGLAMVTDASGHVVERISYDEAATPVFLDTTGLPVGGSSSASGIRWLQPGAAWDPAARAFHAPDGVYSPDLGMVTARKKPPEEKPIKHKTGHVTLIK